MKPKIIPKSPKSRQEKPKGHPNPAKIKEKSIQKEFQKQHDFQFRMPAAEKEGP